MSLSTTTNTSSRTPEQDAVICALIGLSRAAEAKEIPAGTAPVLFAALSSVTPGSPLSASASRDLVEQIHKQKAIIAPDCAACPLQALCLGRQSGNPARLPQKAPKKARKKCELTLCLAQDAAGRWLLQKRGEQGVLAGLWQPPVLAEEALDEKKALAAAQKLLPAAVLLKEKPLKAKHIFTHLEWHMTAYVMAVPCTPPPEGCVWASPAQLEQEYTLPGAFKTLRKRML